MHCPLQAAAEQAASLSGRTQPDGTEQEREPAVAAEAAVFAVGGTVPVASAPGVGPSFVPHPAAAAAAGCWQR